MKLLSHPPLKPLDLSRPAAHASGASAAGRGAAVAAGPLNTTLSQLDRSGVIYHASKNPAAHAIASPADQHQRLVEQTRKWVAQTFFGTLLKQMRDSPFKSDLFEGGRGGQAFSSLYDQRLIDHMSRGAGSKIVNSIVRKIEAKRAYGQQDRAATDATGAMPLTGGADSRGSGASSRQNARMPGPAPKARGMPGGIPAAPIGSSRNVRIHVAPNLRP